jgi:hypothetical protein
MCRFPFVPNSQLMATFGMRVTSPHWINLLKADTRGAR